MNTESFLQDASQKINLYVENVNEPGNVFITHSKPLLTLNLNALPGLKHAIETAPEKPGGVVMLLYRFCDVAILYTNAEPPFMLFVHRSCNLETESKKYAILDHFKDKFKEVIKLINSDYTDTDYQYIHFNFVYPEDVKNFIVN